jgi:hypothetical protein
MRGGSALRAGSGGRIVGSARRARGLWSLTMKR